MKNTAIATTNGNGKPSIVCGLNHVVICGQCIQRPETISPGQWLAFWERLIARELS